MKRDNVLKPLNEIFKKKDKSPGDQENYQKLSNKKVCRLLMPKIDSKEKSND